jgi:hypothetical protein
MRPIRVLFEDGTVLASRAFMAEGNRERLRGWLGRDAPGEGEGLWLKPCASVHTFGMRFAVDVAFMDRSGKVLRVRPRVGPWRVVFGPVRGSFFPWTVTTLELPAGTLEGAGVRRGARLRFEPR